MLDVALSGKGGGGTGYSDFFGFGIFDSGIFLGRKIWQVIFW